MPTLQHTHKYVKYKHNRFNNPNLWKCNDPHCTHFCDRGMAIGKATRCTKCNAEFILSYEDLKRTYPVCLGCSNTKKAKQHRAVKALIEELEMDKTPLADKEPLL